MIRQPEPEQINRLMVKTLDQVFIARAQEGEGCRSSPIAAFQCCRTCPERSAASTLCYGLLLRLPFSERYIASLA
jgi:hypothetical protein